MYRNRTYNESSILPVLGFAWVIALLLGSLFLTTSKIIPETIYKTPITQPCIME